eukprot:m.205890 g.205890  ORF g.205890 m.205890 type:complete len:311 (-) comp25334_c1_seq14:169-1101(-)
MICSVGYALPRSLTSVQIDCRLCERTCARVCEIAWTSTGRWTVSCHCKIDLQLQQCRPCILLSQLFLLFLFLFFVFFFFSASYAPPAHTVNVAAFHFLKMSRFITVQCMRTACVTPKPNLVGWLVRVKRLFIQKYGCDHRGTVGLSGVRALSCRLGRVEDESERVWQCGEGDLVRELGNWWCYKLRAGRDIPVPHPLHHCCFHSSLIPHPHPHQRPHLSQTNQPTRRQATSHAHSHAVADGHMFAASSVGKLHRSNETKCRRFAKQSRWCLVPWAVSVMWGRWPCLSCSTRRAMSTFEASFCSTRVNDHL